MDKKDPFQIAYARLTDCFSATVWHLMHIWSRDIIEELDLPRLQVPANSDDPFSYCADPFELLIFLSGSELWDKRIASIKLSLLAAKQHIKACVAAHDKSKIVSSNDLNSKMALACYALVATGEYKNGTTVDASSSAQSELDQTLKVHPCLPRILKYIFKNCWSFCDATIPSAPSADEACKLINIALAHLDEEIADLISHIQVAVEALRIFVKQKGSIKGGYCGWFGAACLLVIWRSGYELSLTSRNRAQIKDKILSMNLERALGEKSLLQGYKYWEQTFSFERFGIMLMHDAGLKKKTSTTSKQRTNTGSEFFNEVLLYAGSRREDRPGSGQMPKPGSHHDNKGHR